MTSGHASPGRRGSPPSRARRSSGSSRPASSASSRSSAGTRGLAARWASEVSLMGSRVNTRNACSSRLTVASSSTHELCPDCEHVVRRACSTNRSSCNGARSSRSTIRSMTRSSSESCTARASSGIRVRSRKVPFTSGIPADTSSCACDRFQRHSMGSPRSGAQNATSCWRPATSDKSTIESMSDIGDLSRSLES